MGWGQTFRTVTADQLAAQSTANYKKSTERGQVGGQGGFHWRGSVV
jgi:hypothetical protein